MSLMALPFEPDFAPLPEIHQELAQDAIALSDKLSDLNNPQRVSGFVQSTPAVAWAIVEKAKSQFAPNGGTFLEWGAGLGLVTFLAERAGFEAAGLELEPVLVTQSAELAAAHGQSAAIRIGSYKPDGFHDSDTPAADKALFEADITYVYAWPAETEQVKAVFAAHAPAQAILLLYQGGTVISALQRV